MPHHHGANRIKEIAKVRGISQTKIAAQLGMHKSTLSRIASGQQAAAPETKLAIAEILGTDVGETFEVRPCERCGGAGSYRSESYPS